MAPLADLDHCDDQGKAGGAEERERRRRAPPELAQREQSRRASGHEEENEEEPGEGEPGTREQRVDVELHPRDDEEDGDQEAVTDGRDARQHLLARLALRDEADDEARREGAEDEVEIELEGKQHEERQRGDGKAHGELPALVHRLARDADQPRRLDVESDPRSHRDDEPEDGEEGDARHRRVRSGQEQGDDDDRPELAGDCGSERVLPQRRVQDAGVGEDRHERAERGRGDGDGDQPTVCADAGGLEGEAPGRAERDRESPADRATGEEPARDAAVDHLDAREEEEKDDPEVGEELDVLIHLRDVEHLGADEDAEEDLDDDGGKQSRVR